MSESRRVALDSTVAWEAVRAAGGSIRTAARVLGVTPRDLLDSLRADPPTPFGRGRTSANPRAGRGDDEDADRSK